jgi:hypothetical protein
MSGRQTYYPRPEDSLVNERYCAFCLTLNYVLPRTEDSALANRLIPTSLFYE